MPDPLRFAHYEVLRREDGSPFELGRGAMGITYKAFDSNLQMPVALKFINAANLNEEAARTRFVREAQAAAKLRHPNVASVFHLGTESGAYFYAMEFVAGETVEARVQKSGPLEPGLALEITDQVARALCAALRHGLVHRDIKPANLMLVEEEGELVVKLIDFGLAKSFGLGASDVSLGPTLASFTGTPLFASPEQLEERELDARSDIYSLGMTLWYMLLGKPPFAGSMAQVMSQHLTQPPPFEQMHGISEPVVALLRRMIEKDRDSRQKSPAELRHEISHCRSLLAKMAPVVTGPPDPMSAVAPAEIAVENWATDMTVAGRFRILARLGEGDEGGSFHAADSAQGGRDVRLFVLRPEMTADEAALRTFAQEVEVLLSNPHRNILRVLSLNVDENGGFLTCEWTDGFSLLDLLHSRPQLEIAEVLRLLEQAASGVDFAIGHGFHGLNLTLKQTLIHFAPPHPPAQEWVCRNVTTWPAFDLKLNAASITQAPSPGKMLGNTEDLSAGDATVYRIRELGLLVCELLGGKLPPAHEGNSTLKCAPLAALNKQGNAVLARAIGAESSFASAAEFHRALSDAARIAARSSAPSDVSPQAVAASPLPASAPMPLPTVQAGKKRLGSVIAWVTGFGGLAIAAALVWFFVVPLLRDWKGGQPAVVPVTPPPDPPTPPPVPPIPTPAPPTPTPVPPTPTPVPPTPPPTPPILAQKAADLENRGAWPEALSLWVQFAQNPNDKAAAVARIEALLARLQTAPGPLKPSLFDAIRVPLEEAARLDCYPAQRMLAVNLQATDPVAAYGLIESAAKNGNAAALTDQAYMLMWGIGVERDLNFSKVIANLVSASAKGYPAAKTQLAEFNLAGQGMQQDEKHAVALLREAAAQDDLRAMNLLGTCLDKGKGVQKDAKEARQFFAKAADRGYGEALANLAILYSEGRGGEANPSKGRELLQKGSAAGDALCLALEARFLEQGIGDDKPNPAGARAKYKHAAEGGNSLAKDWCRLNNEPFEEHKEQKPALR